MFLYFEDQHSGDNIEPAIRQPLPFLNSRGKGAEKGYLSWGLSLSY